MKKQTTEKMENVIIGVSSGAIAYAGYSGVSEVISANKDMSKVVEEVDDAMNNLQTIATFGAPYSPKQIFQMHLQVSFLRNRFQEGSEVNYLEDTIDGLTFARDMFKPNYELSEVQKSCITGTLACTKYKLEDFKKYETIIINGTNTAALMVGSALMLFGGYFALKGFYKALTHSEDR